MKMQRRRAVVTGVGVLCSVAQDYDQYVAALRDGRPGFSRPRSINMDGFTTELTGEIPDPANENYLKAPRARLRNRCMLLLAQAAEQAFASSGLKLDQERVNLMGAADPGTG